MPIFARRRLQAMLDELAPLLEGGKGRDLLQRLRRKEPEQVLPAEMELALLWALRQVGPIEIEPEEANGQSRPDAFSDRLIPGDRVAIEITAPNDNAISGEADMDRIAQQVIACANAAQRGFGDFLYFSFKEESGIVDGRWLRRRLAPSDYKLSEAAKIAIARWVEADPAIDSAVRLVENGVDVDIRRKAIKQTRYHNIHSTMPSETHSLEDNPLFELIDRKRKQMRDTPTGVRRMLFLADGGSRLLRDIGSSGERDPTGRRKSGSDIIGHFMAKRPEAFDAITVFAPYKEWSSVPDPFGRKPRRWNVTFFGTDRLPDPPPALDRIAGVLPEPHYQGYQARSLLRQDKFKPASRGEYLGMTIKRQSAGAELEIHFSARLLLEMLAGRISEERFRAILGMSAKDTNIFKRWLDGGRMISGAELVPGGVDEDDDHLVLRFRDDPAARDLRLPDPSADEPREPKS